jgi:hypothetical protein
MIAAINANPIKAARHAPSQSGGSGGSFMLFVGCAGDGTRRGWLDHFNSAVAINAHHSKCSIDVDG